MVCDGNWTRELLKVEQAGMDIERQRLSAGLKTTKQVLKEIHEMLEMANRGHDLRLRESGPRPPSKRPFPISDDLK